MTRTIEAKEELVITIPAGVNVTIEYGDASGVKISRRPPANDNYGERELNMLEFIHNTSRLNYVDHVIDMYTNLTPAARMRIMDSLEWTRYSRDFFVRDFIGAVNLEYNNHENHLKKG